MLIQTVFLTLVLASSGAEKDRIYSGPQVGEKTTPFRVFDLTRQEEVDFIEEFGGGPTVLVFVHQLERSILPLLRVIDQYASEHREKLKSLLVFLMADRLEGERRLPIVRQAVGLRLPTGLSPEGIEGPGNYGLNKNCLLTILVAKENQVTANFALVQPGIADAPEVIRAMARAIDDPNPPAPEELLERQRPARNRRPARTRAPGRRMERAGKRLDLSTFDLESEEGLRSAVQALLEEVVSLRAEVDRLRAELAAARKDSEVADPNRRREGREQNEDRKR